MNDPQLDPTFYQIADFSAATNISIESNDIRWLAPRNLFSAGSRRCLVAPTPELFGLARMFRIYRELGGAKERFWFFAVGTRRCAGSPAMTAKQIEGARLVL